jgi:hypothetical protein
MLTCILQKSQNKNYYAKNNPFLCIQQVKVMNDRKAEDLL